MLVQFSDLVGFFFFAVLEKMVINGLGIRNFTTIAESGEKENVQDRWDDTERELYNKKWRTFVRIYVSQLSTE